MVFNRFAFERIEHFACKANMRFVASTQVRRMKERVPILLASLRPKSKRFSRRREEPTMWRFRGGRPNGQDEVVSSFWCPIGDGELPSKVNVGKGYSRISGSKFEVLRGCLSVVPNDVRREDERNLHRVSSYETHSGFNLRLSKLTGRLTCVFSCRCLDEEVNAVGTTVTGR